MGFYCKVCGRWMDIGVGPFCNADCENKFRAEKKREAEKRVEKDNKEREEKIKQREAAYARMDKELLEKMNPEQQEKQKMFNFGKT